MRPAKSDLHVYRDLLITYLRPQWQQALLMILLLFSSISLQLVNPQIIRTFIDTAATKRLSPSFRGKKTLSSP